MITYFLKKSAVVLFSISILSGCFKQIDHLKVDSFYFIDRNKAIQLNNEIVNYDQRSFLLVNINSPVDLFHISKANGVRFNINAYFCEFPRLKIPNFDLAQEGYGYTPSKVKNFVSEDRVNSYQVVLSNYFDRQLMLEESNSARLKSRYYPWPQVLNDERVDLNNLGLDICFFAEAKGAYGKPANFKTNIMKVSVKPKIGALQ
jgi:hypothetical protein